MIFDKIFISNTQGRSDTVWFGKRKFIHLNNIQYKNPAFPIFL